MKRLLLYPLIISLIVLATTACESDPPVPTYNDVLIPDEPDNPDIGDDNFASLANYSAYNYPNEDTWVITDSWATTDDFAGLREAIIALSGSGRRIELEFPNLKSIPDYALFNDGDYETRAQSDALWALEALFSVSAEEATYIGCNAFMYCANLESANLPNADEIQSYAFYGCSSLSSIDSSLARFIGSYAFASCTNLLRIELPQVTNAEWGAFADCAALVSAKLPLVTAAENELFWRCYNLEEVDMSSVNYIHATPFAYCYALESLKLATNVDSRLSTIETESFTDTTTTNITLTIGSANSEYVSGNTLTVGDFSAEFNEIILVDANGEESKTYTTLADFSSDSYPTDSETWIITDTSAELSDFYGLRDALKSEGRKISLIFPNLEEIPTASSSSDGAFYNCKALISIEFLVATTIGDYAFSGCSELSSVELPVATSIGDYAFTSCDALTSIELPVATSIGKQAFGFCDALASVVLPAATSISSNAFYNSYALTSVELPAVTSIGDYAFRYCDALTSLSIATDDNVVISSISSLAFTDAPTTNITLTVGSANSEYVSGNTLTVGGFSEEFKEIILVDGEGEESKTYTTLAEYSATSYPTDTDTWIITDSSATTVDFAGLSAAIEAIAWSGRTISLEFPNMLEIPDYAIFGQYDVDWDYASDVLVSVKADVATSFGDYAFAECSNLASISMAGAITLGEYSFRNCDALKKLSLPWVTTIESNAFWGASGLSDISLPNVDVIGDCAFEYCSSLQTIYMPYVSSIGEGAFMYCDNLTSIDIPSSVTYMGGGIFGECNKLTSVNMYTWSYTLQDGVIYSSDKRTVVSVVPALFSSSVFDSSSAERVEKYAFLGCDTVVSLSLPEVTSIGEYAFRNSALMTLTDEALPKLSTIEKGAFSYCESLTSVNLSKAATIEAYVFSGCTNLSSISLDSVVEVGESMFGYCDGLESISLPSISRIGTNVFIKCPVLTNLELATKAGAKIESISSNAFTDTATINISLTVGSNNSEYITSNTLYVDKYSFSAAFKEIIIVYNEGGAEGDAPDLGYEELF